MGFLRQNRFVVLFLVLLVFCTLMVIRQYRERDSRHVELREAFILLRARGYTNEAERLYRQLLLEIPDLRPRQLLDDFQRTMILVDPSTPQTNNLIWNYHWTVSNELDRRSEETLQRALELAQP